jgi:hypothetical protein
VSFELRVFELRVRRFLGVFRVAVVRDDAREHIRYVRESLLKFLEEKETSAGNVA